MTNNDAGGRSSRPLPPSFCPRTPEPGVDLGRVAGLQEPVEPLEDLHVLAPRRRRAARHRQLPNRAIDVLARDLPRGTPQRRHRPLQQPGVVVKDAGPPPPEGSVKLRKVHLS
jgi:hypothetical protein